MVVATATSSYQNHTFFSNFLSSSPNSNLFPPHLRCLKRQSLTTSDVTAARIRCKAALGSTETKLQKKSQYDIENLTIWLLKQEQAGTIDAELTIVLSSISLACKQIASLLQRSSISSLTGAHGTINIQGEDQKKLDVISNEVGFALNFKTIQNYEPCFHPL